METEKIILHLEIALEPPLSIYDIAKMATNRGTFITESDRMLKEQHLYQIDNEVGLWTFDELKQHFLN